MQNAAAPADLVGDLKEAMTISASGTGPYLETDEKPAKATIKTLVNIAKTNLQLIIGDRNLLVYPYFRGDTYTLNGLTFTVNEDKSITVNGTASAETTYNINYYPTPNWIKEGDIFLSGCEGGSASTYFILNTSSGHAQYNDIIRIAITVGFTLNLAIRVKSGVTLENKVFKPMIAFHSYDEFTPPAKLYTATVPSGTTEYEWTGLEFREGHNLIVSQFGDDVKGDFSFIKTMSEVFDLLAGNVNHWKGKKWVAFGTSITDNYSSNAVITQGDHAGEPTGKYVPYLLQMSKLSQNEFVNRGIAGGSINGHILYYIRYFTSDEANADLITIEGAVNDYARSIPLGVVGDTVPYTDSLLPDSSANGSFAGACYQAFTAALSNSPKAVVVLLTETTGRLHTGYADYNQTRLNSLGLTQYDYIDMTMKVAEFVGIPVINCGRDSMINAQNPQYIADHIHHTYLGGYQYATVIWEKLRNIPLKVLQLPE